MWHACGAEPIFVHAAHMQYVDVLCVQRICTVCAARKQIYVHHTSNISVREAKINIRHSTHPNRI